MNNQFHAENDRYLQEAICLVGNQLALGYELVALHAYTGCDGVPIYHRIRLKKGGDKKILPMHKNDDGRFVLKEPQLPEGSKPLYRLHELSECISVPVFVVEGEACADMLSDLGLLSTTSGSWNSGRKADWSVLAGRDVYVWRDADEVGLKYAEQVTELLLERGCSVKWVDIDKLNLLDGGDCVDWLMAHPNATKHDILQLTCIDQHKRRKSSDDHLHSPDDYPRFEVKKDGVYYCKDASDQGWICSWLVVKALTRDIDSINWGRVLEFEDVDHKKHVWTMPMELVSGNGDEVVRELLRLGLRIAPGGAVRRLLVQYLMNAETEERARCVRQTGWHENCFVLPYKILGNSSEVVLLQTDSPLSADDRPSGTLSDWQKNIAALCVGNSRLLFSVSLAFAAPLLKIIRAENGGFHLRGASSSGKTTVLSVSGSVWGGKDYVQNWRATDNGLEGIASQHNDRLLILDELSQVDPSHAGEIAYMLANGRGKLRASKTGSARQRQNWRLLFLSSGEISLASHMLEAGKKSKAGQEVRMVDISADAGFGLGIFESLHGYPHGAALSDSLKNACDKFHGISGEYFIQQILLLDPLSLLTKIHDLQNKFMDKLPVDAHGQVKRVAQRFSLVAAAGEIATELGVTGWLPEVAMDAAMRCYEAWLGARSGSSGSHEYEHALEQVRHFFQENASRFDVFDSEQQLVNQSIPHRCVGFRSSSGDYYVFPKTFSDEICRGLGSSKEIAKIVEECGWLLPDENGKTSYSSVWVPTKHKTMRLYHFSGKVIGECEEK